MKLLGLSLSPGGLMLPYHMGVLEGLLKQQNTADSSLICPIETPIAGSSSGAIATMAHGCGIDGPTVLEATVRVSDACERLGGARGRLLGFLQEEMDVLIDTAAMDRISQHSHAGIAYAQIFPKRQSYVQTKFASRDDLFKAVEWSCTFPFFATNFPCALDMGSTSTTILPRLMVDGYFSVPRERFGCPELYYGKNDENEENGEDDSDDTVDNNYFRTLAISTFPKSVIKIDAFDDEDCISPPPEMMNDVFRIATQASSRKDLTMVYEQGIMDAEAWCRKELKLEAARQKTAREEARRSNCDEGDLVL